MSTPTDVAPPEAAQPPPDAPHDSPDPSSARSALWARDAAIGAAAMVTWWVGSWLAADSYTEAFCPAQCARPSDPVIGAGLILAVAGVIAFSWDRGQRLAPWVVGSLAGLATWLVIGAPVASLWLPVLAAGIVTWRTGFPFQRVFRAAVLGFGWYLISGFLSLSAAEQSIQDAALGGSFGSTMPPGIEALGPLFGLVLLEVVTAWVLQVTGAGWSARPRGLRWRWLAAGVAIVVGAALLWFPDRLPNRAPEDLAAVAAAAIPPENEVFEISIQAAPAYGLATVVDESPRDFGARVHVNRYGSPALLDLVGVPGSTLPGGADGIDDFFCREDGKCDWVYVSAMGQYGVYLSAGPMTDDEFRGMLDRVLASLDEELSGA